MSLEMEVATAAELVYSTVHPCACGGLVGIQDSCNFDEPSYHELQCLLARQQDTVVAGQWSIARVFQNECVLASKSRESSRCRLARAIAHDPERDKQPNESPANPILSYHSCPPPPPPDDVRWEMVDTGGRRSHSMTSGPDQAESSSGLAKVRTMLDKRPEHGSQKILGGTSGRLDGNR